MKIVIAPNAFKGSMSSREAANAIEAGVRRVVPEVETIRVPVADGGDGLHEIFKEVFPGEEREVEVTGPTFTPIRARYYLMPSEKTAVIEMACASGLALLQSEERDVCGTTTYGTGELALAAIEAGAKKIVIGLGGSATTDGGVGFVSALGVRFLDSSANEVKPVGGELAKIADIDVSGLKFDPAEIAWEAVCDVDNPLTGTRGAAAVFGPQKGATPEDVRLLDAGLRHLANQAKKLLGKDLSELPGAGAAGGLGFGLAAFVDATLRPGVEVVLDMVGIDQALEDADLAFTAEGMIDFQTAFGKGPAGVALRAKKYGVPCLALAGGISGDISSLHEIGINACFSLCPGPMKLQDAITNGVPLLTNASEQAFRAFLAGKKF